MLSIFLIVLLAILATGMPVAFALGLTLIVLVYSLTSMPMIVVAQQIMVGADNYSLVAIPFFMLAAEIMLAGGITRRIISAFLALIGWVRGGLALTNISASLVMASFSGSAVADATMIGSVMIPAMKSKGYPPALAASITASASILGIIVPPSIPMIVLGFITGTSVLDMFLGGVIPGILLGLAMMIAAFFVCLRLNVPREQRLPCRAVGVAVLDAVWALGLPVLIVGGIRFGVFTVVESSVIAVVYALVVSSLVYREIKLSDLFEAMSRAAVTSAVVMFIVAAATGSAWLMASEQVPQAIAASMSSLTDSSLIFMLITIAFLLVVGMVIDLTPALLILGPILMPVAVQFGISPVHFAIVMVVSLALGLITPPVGTCLYLTSSIAKVSVTRVIVTIIPFVSTITAILLLIALVPGLSTWLPSVLN